MASALMGTPTKTRIRKVRNTKLKPDLPELCAAVRRVREAGGLSQERFGQQVGVAGQTVSNFEVGRAVPRDINILIRLREAAADAGLIADEALFSDAINAHQKSLSPRCPPRVATYSPHEWRLMQAARIASRYFPDLARRMEVAAGEALAIVDEALASANLSSPADSEFYLNLEPSVDRIAAARFIQAIKEDRRQKEMEL